MKNNIWIILLYNVQLFIYPQYKTWKLEVLAWNPDLVPGLYTLLKQLVGEVYGPDFQRYLGI